jgi:integrase
VLKHVRTFFRWACKKKLIVVDPTTPIEPPFPDNERDRVIDDDEIRLFWRACDEIGYPFGPLHQLLLLLAQRRSEVGEMERVELKDLERHSLWGIRKERTKNSKEHLVPLIGLARKILERPLLSAPGDEFVFTISGEQPATGFANAKTEIDRLMLEYRRQELAAAGRDPDGAKIDHWIVHDLRRTATTGVISLGHAEWVADKVLNHTPERNSRGKVSSVHRIYNKYEYLAERRKALEDWGRYVEELVHGKSAAVAKPVPTTLNDTH